MPDLLVSELSKAFPTRGEPLVVLRDVSFDMSRGQNLAVLGPSGSGKSTLLHLLGALDRPTSGQVRLGDEEPFQLNELELARFRSHRVGFVFQDHHLLPQCNVLENVLIPTVAESAATADDLQRARELLDRVGLSDRLEHRPAELSGGERQRVAIARALVRRPLLLLADEPTGNLDRSTAGKVADLLLELWAQEQTMMIVVTHSLDLAGKLERQAEIDDGRLIF